MDHPMLQRINRTGYPQTERKVIRVDQFGKPIFVNDELLCIEDIEFVAEELSSDAKEILTMLGATYQIAEK